MLRSRSSLVGSIKKYQHDLYFFLVNIELSLFTILSLVSVS
jgi:hypothetical protein